MPQNSRRTLPGSACPIALACTIALLSTSAAFGQPAGRLSAPGATPTAIRFNFSGGCAFDDDAPARVTSIANLAADYNDGTRWAQLQQEVKAVLASCLDLSDPKGPHDLSGALAKTLLVIVVDKDAPYYLVLPQHQPYSLSLTGAIAVVPVVLVDASARRGPPDLRLLSTRVQDPSQQQIPAFVRTIATRVIRQSAATGGQNPRIWAYAADEVELPFRRAVIAESGNILVGCDPDGSSAVLAPCPRGKDSVDVDLSASYADTPKTRIEFGAVAGAVVGPYRGHTRMKVDSGRYAADPATHSMTMAAIAIHVKPYDGALADISSPERWSLLVGGVLTPAAGIGAGISFAFMRGFAITAGEVALWVPTGASAGALAPAGSSQLPHRYSYGTFVAAGYSFSSR